MIFSSRGIGSMASSSFSNSFRYFTASLNRVSFDLSQIASASLMNSALVGGLSSLLASEVSPPDDDEPSSSSLPPQPTTNRARATSASAEIVEICLDIARDFLTAGESYQLSATPGKGEFGRANCP